MIFERKMSMRAKYIMADMLSEYWHFAAKKGGFAAWSYAGGGRLCVN